jgi:DNA-binding NtrC family response regulator
VLHVFDASIYFGGMAAMTLPILVVDHDPQTCALMAKLLLARGYHVDVALNGRTALQFIEQNRHGVAIIRYQMPGMNGVDLFRRMRQARPGLSGVFLTGITTIDPVYPATEAGVLRVVSKPADFEDLLPILKDRLHSVDELPASIEAS